MDALVAPVFDPSMLQHVAASSKKFIQERDRELAGIQRAMLNATGPLCTLHDQLEQWVTLQPQDLKLFLQQTLFLGLPTLSYPHYGARKFLPRLINLKLIWLPSHFQMPRSGSLVTIFRQLHLKRQNYLVVLHPSSTKAKRLTGHEIQGV